MATHTHIHSLVPATSYRQGYREGINTEQTVPVMTLLSGSGSVVGTSDAQ